jgi:phosphatidylserine decarboxylase
MLSRLTGRVADLRLPGFLRGPVIGGFARLVGIDTAEAEAPPKAYPSVGAYFVRRLKPGARGWPDDPAVPASPVDGIVGAFGLIDGGRLIQAKGIDYDAGELLGDPAEGAGFEGGSFLTIYLSPRHYHRIHTPLAGTVTLARSLPGRLLPVNLPAVRSIPDLFPTNERLVVHIEGGNPVRPVALVAVGAMNVGRISAAFAPGWHTNRSRRERPGPEERRPGVRVGTGAELAAFHLGSTVVILFPPRREGAPLPPFAPEVREGAQIRLGAPLFEG